MGPRAVRTRSARLCQRRYPSLRIRSEAVLLETDNLYDVVREKRPLIEQKRSRCRLCLARGAGPVGNPPPALTELPVTAPVDTLQAGERAALVHILRAAESIGVVNKPRLGVSRTSPATCKTSRTTSRSSPRYAGEDSRR